MEAATPPVMTIAEVAEYLRIPRASVYKLAQRGKIPCQKVGRHWRFRRLSVEAWLDENRNPRQIDVRGPTEVDEQRCEASLQSNERQKES